MAIKNYSTTIPAAQTVGEIQGILAAHGAKSVMMNYDERREPNAVMFIVETPLGDRLFKLPANKVLQSQKVKCDREQATKVAWRNIKDWISAQMALLETAMVTSTRFSCRTWQIRRGRRSINSMRAAICRFSATEGNKKWQFRIIT